MEEENKKYTIKEQHTFTCEQKLKYLGYGEWVEECDKVEIEYKGYKCGIQRVIAKEPYTAKEHYFGGHLCGYVEIPKDHVYFGMKTICDIDCHGGLTFNEKKEHDHVIGFDCAHHGDILPSMEFFKKQQPSLRCLDKANQNLKDLYPNCAMFNPTYKNMAFCIGECLSIVDQLIEIQNCTVKLRA